MAFYVGDKIIETSYVGSGDSESRTIPFTRDGIPYLYSSGRLVDSDRRKRTANNYYSFSPLPRTTFYCDDSAFGPTGGTGFDYATISIGATSSSARFGSTLAIQDGIVAVGAPRTNYDSRQYMGMVVLFDCPMKDSIGNTTLTRIAPPDYTSYTSGAGVYYGWHNFGSDIAIDDNKIVIAAENWRASSWSAGDGRILRGKAWLYDIDGTLITELDPNSQGVEYGKDSSAGQFGNIVRMDAGTIAVQSSHFNDSSTGHTGLISLFDYSGNLKKHIRTNNSGFPYDKLNSLRPLYGYWVRQMAMADGHIVVHNDDGANNGNGYLYRFDYAGNFTGYVNLDDYVNIYFSGPASQASLTGIGMGCGRIVVGVQDGTSDTDWQYVIMDYDFNLIEIVDTYSLSFVSFLSFSGRGRNDGPKGISIKNGVIAIGTPYETGGVNGMGNGLQTGGMLFLNLDGEYMGHVQPMRNPLNEGQARSYHYFGQVVDIGHGTVMGGGYAGGDVWKWHFNPRYTPHDVLRLNRPRGY